MPYQDFRQFLDVLRQHGELIDVNRPVALNDVGKAMKQSYVRQGPAIMFTQNGTDYPLVAGVYSTRSKALLAFEADEDTIFDKVLTGLDNPIAPTAVAGKAPCQDEVITGDDIDIRRWPIPTYSPKDGGPYITPGIVVSEGSGNRHPRHRPLPLSDPRQGHGLVLGATVPPFRQASRQAQAPRHACRRPRW